MQVTTREMRSAVAGWLREEAATVEQALKLQSALEAGAISGNEYVGNRWGSANTRKISAVRNYRQRTGAPLGAGGMESCGCLVDTLERMRRQRPVTELQVNSASTFALATLIGIGDTPENSKWVRAAVAGIEDYLSTIEVAV